MLPFATGFAALIGAMLGRFVVQTGRSAPADAVVCEFARNLHGVISERGLPPSLPGGDGHADGLSRVRRWRHAAQTGACGVSSRRGMTMPERPRFAVMRSAAAALAPERRARFYRLGRIASSGLGFAGVLSAQTWQLADDETIRARAEQYVEARHAPGVVVGILDLAATPERRVRFFSFGKSGRADVPLGPDTMFEWGSITKAMTGLLVGELIAHGELQLGSTLGDLTATLKPLLPADVAAITVEQLSTHRSGLPRLSFHPFDLLPMVLRRDPYAGTTAAGVFTAAARAPRRVGPGTFAYSNLGFATLGQALAWQSDRRFDELLRDRVLAPYGLGAVATSPDAAPAGRLAQGHAANLWPAPHWHVDGYAAAGCLVGSARDLVGFFQGVLKRPTAGWEIATTPRHPTDKSGRRHVGLGWMLRQGENGTLAWHNGGTGGFRTFAGVVPEQKIALVVLTNGSGNADALALGLIEQGRRTPPPRRTPWLGLAMSLLGLLLAPTIAWRVGRNMGSVRPADRVDALLAIASAAFLLALSATHGAWQTIHVAAWWAAMAVTVCLSGWRLARSFSSRKWLNGSRVSQLGRMVLLVIFTVLAVLVVP